MGGLICRAAIPSLDADPRHRDMVGPFVTFASPFGGHAAFKWGLTMTPEPVPAWIDRLLHRAMLRKTALETVFRAAGRSGIAVHRFGSRSLSE